MNKKRLTILVELDPKGGNQWIYDSHTDPMGMYRHGVEVLAIKEGDYFDHIADLKDEGE